MQTYAHNFVKSYDAKNIDIQKLAHFLYNRRIASHSTQKEMAVFLCTTTSNYQRYEVGKVKRIPYTFVEKLCEKFGVPAESFIELLEPYKDDLELSKWLHTKESRPYIEEAYRKYLLDERNKLEDKIKGATYGKIDL